MIEEFKHNADGSLVPKDPNVLLGVEGTRVRMINEASANSVGCRISNGMTGVINKRCAESNGIAMRRRSENFNFNVYVQWDNNRVFWCKRDCIEVIS